MQFGQAQNQLLLEQLSANNNSQFDQKIERRRFSLLNADKSQSCSPVKKQKKRDVKEEKIDLDFVNENTLNAIASNLKLFYELEIEQSSITLNQQIMNLKAQIQKKDIQENNLMSEIKRIKLKYDQLLIDHELQAKELNHKYKYQLELFKCQVEQQINEYSSQIADVMSKNAELLDILSADHSICQKYTSLFKNYKNGQAYQEVITKNINLANENRLMKIDQQIIQSDNSNYIQQLSKLSSKVNLYQKLNEERQQELIEKDQIIQLHQKQNEQMQLQYQTLLQEFSSKVLALIKQKDILQDQITQRLQKQLNESVNQRKEYMNNNESFEKNISQLSTTIKEYKKQNLLQSQKIDSLEQRLKHQIENSVLSVEAMRNDSNKLIKLHEKNNQTKNDQFNSQIQNQKQFYEKQLTDWKNNYYKVSQKLCELEQNITNGPKYYLQKAYEDYQQNVQRTIEATESKIQDLMQQNLKLQNALSYQSNENSILKDQIVELKESNQNYLDLVHNSQRESLQQQEKAQMIGLMYEENKSELQEIKSRLQKEQELRQIIEKEQNESQIKLELQIQNLKREIISLTQSSKPQNHFQDQNNPSLKIEKISLSTQKHFNSNNQIQNQNNLMVSAQKTQYNNSGIFNSIGLDINQDTTQNIEQLFESTQNIASQTKTQLKQSQLVNAKNININVNNDYWQMQSFCSRMMSDFQANFEKTLSAIKNNIDKQYHNSFLKEIRLTIEKDSRVLDLPFEEKKQFTLKATEYFALVLDSKMKELKIQILISQISNLMNTELKEKLNLQIQLEKALKENVALQKVNQNRIGNESEDFKNVLQNQINRLFQNLKDLDAQKLQQIEVRQIEQAIRKELSVLYETKLNMELEENKKFIAGMQQEYNNLLKMHEERVSDITIKLGSEIEFLHSQLEKKIQAAIHFNSSGKIENLNQSLFPQQQVFSQEQPSPKQSYMPLTTTQNFLKNISLSNNKENNKRNSLNSENSLRQNPLIQTMSVLNQSIPYKVIVKTANQQDNTQNNQRQSLRFGGRQLTVSQHMNTTGEISTLPSSNINFIKNNQQSQSLEHGININFSPQHSSLYSKERDLYSKPSVSYSLESNKEIQLPTSIKSEISNKKCYRKRYLNQSVDILEGIREERQNKLKDFLNTDINEVSSKENNNSFNDHDLRKTYQHFVLPSKSVEPGIGRANQSGLGTKKHLLNQTISVLKDSQPSSKSQNSKRIAPLAQAQKNILQGVSPTQINLSNKGQIQQTFKHFNNQNNQSRQKLKLSQLALISNESINLQMQQSNSNQAFNSNLHYSFNKQ